MPKPDSKKTLLSTSQENYDRLMNYIDQFNQEDYLKEFPKKYLNRNMRDVVAHMHHWHLLFLGWYKEGMKGNKPAMPAEGYTWKKIGELNKEVQKKYSTMPFKEVRKLFMKSHAKVYAIIEKHSDKELFTKKKYFWTGSTSLGAYLISNCSSHYEWGRKLIKKGLA